MSSRLATSVAVRRRRHGGALGCFVPIPQPPTEICRGTAIGHRACSRPASALVRATCTRRGFLPHAQQRKAALRGAGRRAAVRQGWTTMLDALLRPAQGKKDLDPALAGAPAQAAAALARLDQALAGHPLLPAFLHRARLEAVRRQAAVEARRSIPGTSPPPATRSTCTSGWWRRTSTRKARSGRPNRSSRKPRHHPAARRRHRAAHVAQRRRPRKQRWWRPPSEGVSQSFPASRNRRGWPLSTVNAHLRRAAPDLPSAFFFLGRSSSGFIGAGGMPPFGCGSWCPRRRMP